MAQQANAFQPRRVIRTETLMGIDRAYHAKRVGMLLQAKKI